MTATAMVEPTVRLKLAGEKHNMIVRRCRILPFGRRPEVEFESEDRSTVWMPESSANRQLERLGLTMATIVGRHITIRRDPNQSQPEKPFWGIYLNDTDPEPQVDRPARPRAVATEPPVRRAAARAEQQQPEAPPPTAADAPDAPANPVAAREARHHLYEKITKYVLTKIVPQYAEAGVPVTMEGTAACIHTLFIAASRR